MKRSELAAPTAGAKLENTELARRGAAVTVRVRVRCIRASAPAAAPVPAQKQRVSGGRAYYYPDVMPSCEPADVSYRVRWRTGDWLAATPDPGEHIEVECGPVRASLGLGKIYEDTGLAAA